MSPSKGDVMKRRAPLLGTLGLLLLTAACSGTAEDPAPFPDATDLSTRLSRDLGCTTYVETDGQGAFVAVQGKSRVVVAPAERGVADAARAWIAPYAADLGLPEGALRVLGETRDEASMLRVVLSNGVPGDIEAPGQDVEITFDPEGRALGIVAHTPPTRLDYTPKMSADAAIKTAKATWANDRAAETAAEPIEGPDAPTATEPVDFPAQAKLVLVPFPGEDTPRLAHRVDAGPKSIWVDAATGEVITQSDGIASLKADMRGWKGYSKIPFPADEKVKNTDYEMATGGVALSRAKEGDTFFSKPKSRIVVSAFKSLQRGTDMPEGTPIVAPSTALMDVGYQGTAQNQAPAVVDGLGVDAMLEGVRAESYFQNHLFASPSRRLKVTAGIPVLVDEPIEIIVHTNYSKSADLANPRSVGLFRDNAASVGGTTKIIVGDGSAALLDSKGGQDATANRSPALSTDSIAHEMTHMWLDMRSTGEAAAIEEGLADVVGQFVEHEVAELRGLSSRPDRIGEGVTLNPIVTKEGKPYVQNGIRSLADPAMAGFAAATTGSQDCLLKVGGKLVRDARGLPKLDPNQVRSQDGASYCAHFNATVVGHAFYLMTFGGKNPFSHLVVRNPIGWSVSERLWISMLAKVMMPAGYRSIVPLDYMMLARQQLASAMFCPKEVANAVGCAWEAVEVLPRGTTQKVTGLACTKVAPIDCSRRRDGVYCDEMNDFSSTRCQNGQIGASPPQCPSDTQCRSQGGFVNNPAILDANGNLRCFNRVE